MDVKNIAWIDAVRVYAALAVIIDHYSRTFPEHDPFQATMLSLVHLGSLGVLLFFAISGYLVPRSLERSSSIWEFYRKKLVRVVIPFTVSYIVFGAFLVFLGLFSPALAGRSTFFHALYQGGLGYEGLLTGIFPLELNLVMYLGIPYAGFIGEWFMGVIVILFLLAPLLYKCMRRAPIISLIVSLTISVVIFFEVQDLWEAGRILNGFWIPFTRIPEFMFGMILFTYKDFFQRHKKRFLPFAVIFLLIFMSYSVATYGWGGVGNHERWYPLHPISFVFSLPTIYIFFNVLEYLTEKFPKVFETFNKFSDISYMAMLIQHVIIYEFTDNFQAEFFSMFGIVFLFPIVLITIIILSIELKKFSDPVEKFFMPKRKN